MVLTAKGDILLEYAKKILALNDECISRINGEIMKSTVKIGIPAEIALSVFPQILGTFSALHKNVTLNVSCDLSCELVRNIELMNLDIVLAIHNNEHSSMLRRVWKEAVVWVMSKNFVLNTDAKIPLVLFPNGCRYRSRILSALAKNKLDSEIIYCSHNLPSNQVAIESGLGISALTVSCVPETMKMISHNDILPRLENVEIGLYYNPETSTTAVNELAKEITEILDANISDNQL